MTLGSDILAELPNLRAAAESMMVDRWVVERVTAGVVLDEESGEYEDTVERVYPPAESEDVDGPGRYRAANVAVNDVDVVGQQLIVSAAILALPVATSGGVREGDYARCTSSVMDPALVGVRVRVEAPHVQTFATARRFRVELTNE